MVATMLCKKMEAFCKKIDTKPDDYNIVLMTIKAFLIKLFTAAVKGDEYTK